MPDQPPARPLANLPNIRNSTQVEAAHMQGIDSSQAWLAVVRRHPIEIPLPVPLTYSNAPVGTPMEFRLRLPPYCQIMQWGCVATGEGEVNVQASAAPSSEAFYGTILIDRPDGTHYDEIWQVTSRECNAPTADGEFRPIETALAVTGAWENQDIEVWVVDGSAAVNVHMLLFYAVSRAASDGDIA